MKQYKDQPTNFAGYACSATWKRHANLEAVIGKSYDRIARNVRRSHSRSAVTWWRQQVNNEGMPWLYHCGGVV